MLRIILIVISLLLYLILGIPALAIEWIAAKKNPYASSLRQLRSVQHAFRFFLFLAGTHVNVIGEENVPKDKAVLYIGNHRSYFDILITYSRCPGLTGYVAKNSMEKVPILSIWMKRLYCLFINRENLKEGLKTILAGIDQIKNGISMCIFPEGTRGEGETELDMLPFHEGSFKMAEKSGCPIIPMAITGSYDIFERQFPLIRHTEVTLQYGAPIYINDLDKEDKRHIGQYTKNIISNMLKENQG